MERLTSEASLLPDHQRELYRSERLGVWTKMRPGVREFLQRAADKFELWAYSSGARYTHVTLVRGHLLLTIDNMS